MQKSGTRVEMKKKKSNGYLDGCGELIDVGRLNFWGIEQYQIGLMQSEILIISEVECLVVCVNCLLLKWSGVYEKKWKREEWYHQLEESDSVYVKSSECLWIWWGPSHSYKKNCAFMLAPLLVIFSLSLSLSLFIIFFLYSLFYIFIKLLHLLLFLIESGMKFRSLNYPPTLSLELYLWAFYCYCGRRPLFS